MRRPLKLPARPAAPADDPPDPDEPAAPAAEADPLAARFRAAYCHARARWESARTGRPTRYTPPQGYDGRPAVVTDDGAVLQRAVASVWARGADQLRRAGVADPVEFVAFQLQTAVGASAPEPAQLFTPARLAAWAEREKAAVPDARTRARTETAAVSTAARSFRLRGYSEGDALALALTDRLTQAGPLMRYCAARAAGTPRFAALAAGLEAAAAAEYVRHRAAYRAAWAVLLPPGWDARAERLWNAGPGPAERP